MPVPCKKAVTDDLNKIFNYKHKIALIAPSMYLQFKDNPDINAILTGIKELGFDEVLKLQGPRSLSPQLPGSHKETSLHP